MLKIVFTKLNYSDFTFTKITLKITCQLSK